MTWSETRVHLGEGVRERADGPGRVHAWRVRGRGDALRGRSNGLGSPEAPVTQAILASAFLAGILAGCRDGESDFEVTPGGYRVVEVVDNGSFSSGLISRGQAFAWLDIRVDEWATQFGPGDPEALKAMARQRVLFTIIDDYRFECVSSKTGFCAGSYSRVSGVVTASIYARVVTSSYPAGAPPWTIRDQGDGTWTHGEIQGGVGLAVIPHELQHFYPGLEHE